MAKFTVSIPMEAPTPESAKNKAKLLIEIAENVTEDNLKFLASLSQKPNINKTLANKLTRILIQSKL
jgi:hypothetical protein